MTRLHCLAHAGRDEEALQNGEPLGQIESQDGGREENQRRQRNLPGRPDDQRRPRLDPELLPVATFDASCLIDHAMRLSDDLFQIANHLVIRKPRPGVSQIRQRLPIDQASCSIFLQRKPREREPAGQGDEGFQTGPACLVRLDKLMDIHSKVSLDRKIVVRTPEHLEVSYELAGAGTRAAAYAIDFFLRMMVLYLFQNLIAAFMMALPAEMRIDGAAVLGVLSFIGIYAYWIIFELLWAGQSPGKRMVGIRVVKMGGYALAVPGLVAPKPAQGRRFPPRFYGTGLMSLLLTRHCQRIGDVVAGTLVVYQDRNTADAVLSTTVTGNQTIQLPMVKLHAIPPDVVETCDEFLRTKDQLAPKYRQQLAADLLDLIEQWSGLFPEANQSAEAFIGCVVSQAGQIPVASFPGPP